jgi:hypothetical protein
VIKSISFDGVGVPPPEKIPRVEFAADALPFKDDCKSPKSTAFDVVAKVT